MPLPMAVMGSLTSHQFAPVLLGSLTTFAMGFPVARIGDPITPHGLFPHDVSIIITGSATVLVEGRPVARVGDLCSCGAIILTTPVFNVFVPFP